MSRSGVSDPFKSRARRMALSDPDASAAGLGDYEIVIAAV